MGTFAEMRPALGRQGLKPMNGPPYYVGMQGFLQGALAVRTPVKPVSGDGLPEKEGRAAMVDQNARVPQAG